MVFLLHLFVFVILPLPVPSPEPHLPNMQDSPGLWAIINTEYSMDAISFWKLHLFSFNWSKGQMICIRMILMKKGRFQIVMVSIVNSVIIMAHNSLACYEKGVQE